MGLKSIVFRGLVWKRVRKITLFGLKSGQDLENRAAHPQQESRGVPPGFWDIFPHIEYIDLQKGNHRNKFYFNSIFKGVFFGKRFRPIIDLQTITKKKRKVFTILNVPHVGFLCYLDSDEILSSAFHNNNVVPFTCIPENQLLSLLIKLGI